MSYKIHVLCICKMHSYNIHPCPMCNYTSMCHYVKKNRAFFQTCHPSETSTQNHTWHDQTSKKNIKKRWDFPSIRSKSQVFWTKTISKTNKCYSVALLSTILDSWKRVGQLLIRKKQFSHSTTRGKQIRATWGGGSFFPRSPCVFFRIFWHQSRHFMIPWFWCYI